MKPYSDYSAEELAMENLFIRWVRFPDDLPIRTFWESWIVKYPSMKETVDKARELVLSASDWKPESLSNQEVNSIWDRIRSSLEIIKDGEPGNPALKGFGNKISVLSLVLSVISLMILAIFYYFFFSTK